jgi:signal transduction histidine kinase
VVLQTVAAAPGGRLWIGTAGDGLFEWAEGKLRQYGERAGLSDSSITALLAEEQGAVWIGTRNGGLNRLAGGTVKRFNTPWGFLGNFASVMVRDRAGGLWIGTTGDGLFELNAGRFTGHTETNGLSSRDIRTLHADQAGSLWVGTARGLCRVKAGQITAFADRKGLPDEPILQLRGDRDGHLWLGANSGIVRLRTEQLDDWAAKRAGPLDAIACGSEDGLPGLQCLPKVHGRSGADGPGGLWFATTKGLVMPNPEGLEWNMVAPRTVLEQVRVDNESAALGEPIRVLPGKESLQFHFTATSLTAPGKVRFRYLLEGFDHVWSEPSNLRMARYARVPPGEYRFRVVGCNNDGIWSEEEASATVIVEPFWWHTAWFRLALAGTAAGLLGGFYRLREVRRAEIERLRVRIAGDLHDDIGSSLWSITLLSRMLAKHSNLDTEARQDVEDIHRISIQTANAIRDIIWLVNPAFDSVQDLALRTKDFAGTVLRGVEYRVRCEGVDPARRLSLDLRQNVFLLFKEALTNVARHAEATAVEVAIEQRGAVWRFSVQDNGKGFEAGRETGGNGLKNLRARARKMGAELAIHSTPGQGTTVIWTISRPARAPREGASTAPGILKGTMTP